MDTGLIKKIDELIDIFENSNDIEKMQQLKKEIAKDIELKALLDKYNKGKDNPYSTDKLSLKKSIIENSKIKEYRELEQQLYLLVLQINKKLNTLIDEKSCF